MVKYLNLGLTHPTTTSFVNHIVKSPPTKLESVKAIADSGANINLGTLDTPCHNLHPTKNGIHAKLPDGSVIQATHTAVLNLPGLSETARTLHIFPQLQSGALLSLGALCNDRCEIILTNNALYVTKDTRLIISGNRNFTTGMWEVDIGNKQQSTNKPEHPPIAHINNVLADATKPELAKYYHAACFSPVKSTWLKAIKQGFFKSWPGLTEELITKHLPASMNTSLGHMHQTRQGLRSTKTKTSVDNQLVPDVTTRTNLVYATILDPTDPTGNIYTDLCGRFPILSSQGNKYIFVLYDYDSNAILARAMKNRSDSEMVKVFTELADYLTTRGFKPQYQVLDNEASKALKKAIVGQNITYQLAPPGNHRQNNAERAIQTFKNHFVAGLCSVDGSFPLQQWDRMLEQATITLNLLRKSRLHPQLSSQCHLAGEFDYNATPIAPPGTKIISHDKPKDRATWAPHGEVGWYMGPAMEHYRCHRVYITKTRATRVSDTVDFFPQHFSMPKMSSADAATIAAQDLTHALLNPAPAAPYAALNQAQQKALTDLAEIFRQVTPRQRPPRVPAPKTITQEISTTVPATTNPLPEPIQARPVPATNPGPPPRVPVVEPDTPVPPPRVATDPPIVFKSGPAPTREPTTGPTIIPEDTVRSFDGKPLRTPTAHRHNTRQRSQANHVATVVPPDTTYKGKTPDITTTVRKDYYIQHNHVSGQVTVIPRANHVICEDTGKTLEYRALRQGKHKKVWTGGMCNELGRLAQGWKDKVGTNTIFFIERGQVPQGRKATYVKAVCDIRPHKEETHRVRLTAGGNLVDYPGNVSTPTADITTIKTHWNSVISEPKARYMCMDVKDFYLNNDMSRSEFIRIPVEMIPTEFMDAYNLWPLVSNGYAKEKRYI